MWYFSSFHRKHWNHESPECAFIGLSRNGEPVARRKKLARKLEFGLAHVVSWYGHGGEMWFMRDRPPAGVEFQWDGVLNAGLLEWLGDGRKAPRGWDARHESARVYLEVYTRAWEGEEPLDGRNTNYIRLAVESLFKQMKMADRHDVAYTLLAKYEDLEDLT